jgi:7-cyano-7-deazaguanine reductase
MGRGMLPEPEVGTRDSKEEYAASTLPIYDSFVAEYTEEHARAGIGAPLPAIETWANQFPAYEITVEIPEYNAICPKTGLPDFGHLTIRYVPDKLCLELKSLKLYIVAYRNVGIFYENAVNRILEDCVAACRPRRMSVKGVFSSRGGISSVVEVSYPRG